MPAVGASSPAETEDLFDTEIESGADPECCLQRRHHAPVLYPVEVALRQPHSTCEIVLAQVPRIQDADKLVLHTPRA